MLYLFGHPREEEVTGREMLSISKEPWAFEPRTHCVHMGKVPRPTSFLRIMALL